MNCFFDQRMELLIFQHVDEDALCVSQGGEERVSDKAAFVI
jgi:hypothetical protein